MNKSVFFLLCALASIVCVNAIVSDDNLFEEESIECTFYEVVEDILFVHAADALSDPAIERASIAQIIISAPVKGSVTISDFDQLQNIFYDSRKVQIQLDASTKPNLIDTKDLNISVEHYPELISQAPKCPAHLTTSLSWSDWLSKCPAYLTILLSWSNYWVSEYITHALAYLIVVP